MAVVSLLFKESLVVMSFKESLLGCPYYSRITTGLLCSHPASTSQAKLREQEEALRSEMLERERGLLGQLRESEARLIEREGEWRARESALHQQVCAPTS